MLILTGNNLGMRHRDFNSKVREATNTRQDFIALKNQDEKCDVDRLFKIDLASKYKNIDYIIEILKCGDIFYITRALKCLWIYSDEYSSFINIEYLKENIFPHMSTKMKRKVLTAISSNLKNGERAIDFYAYCKETGMLEYAYKFLIYTPCHFKLDLLNNSENFRSFRDSKYLKQFIGDSFDLAIAYILLNSCQGYIIHELRFLYSVSNEKYLNILQEFDYYDAKYPNSSRRLGLRISKDILKIHKNRVIEHPVLYVNKLQKNMLIKYLTVEDVKLLAHKLLPVCSKSFWSIDFYRTYKFILEKIPGYDMFNFLKQMFMSKYPDESFEMSTQFYKSKYYEMFNIDEREAWALLHIERDEEWSEIENYMWYKFVRFTKAFPALKRFIFLNPDEDTRSQIINILPQTTRNEKDVTNMLSYYYQRHVNEKQNCKESFIDKVIQLNDIYSFNNECWIFLDKLFYSLDVYNTAIYEKLQYKLRSLIYYILHDKELLEVHKELIDFINFYEIDHIINELSNERNTYVAKYLLNFYAEKLGTLIENSCNVEAHVGKENSEYEISSLIYRIWDVIYCFKREHSDCPKIAMDHMKSNMDTYACHETFKVKFIKRTEGDFLRWLKTDTQQILDGISEIRKNAYRWNFRLCALFRKLKVYFSYDVGQKYLEYFQSYLSNLPNGRREYRNIKMAVLGVLYLADERSKNEFIEKYIPENPKIDHMEIDNRLLQVQKAICRLAYHSRPPLPLSTFRKYIVGDYVHYCLPVFYNYLANSTSIFRFIESVVDAPLSIQKHGLRLAFATYSSQNLCPLIKKAWKNTKNVSLRKILYETLFNRTVKENEDEQKILYDVLKYFTTELNHDDHENLYLLLVSNDLPDDLRGDFIQTAWVTVSKLSDKVLDTNRKTSVIIHMENNILLFKREFLHQIIDAHINDMLVMKTIRTYYDQYHIAKLIEAKWDLCAKYIVTFKNKEEQKICLETIHKIVTISLESWNQVDENVYTLRKFLYGFIRLIIRKEEKAVATCGYMVPVYKCILDNLQKSLNINQIYFMMWELKLTIASRIYLFNGRDCGLGKLCSTVTKSLANKIARMIRSFTKDGEFHPTFYQSVANVINNIIEIIGYFLSLASDCIRYDLFIDLTNIKMNETNILALVMLPRDAPRYQGSEHRKVIANLNKLNTKEIQTLMYEKFVLSDYTVRDGFS